MKQGHLRLVSNTVLLSLSPLAFPGSQPPHKSCRGTCRQRAHHSRAWWKHSHDHEVVLIFGCHQIYHKLSPLRWCKRINSGVPVSQETKYKVAGTLQRLPRLKFRCWPGASISVRPRDPCKLIGRIQVLVIIWLGPQRPPLFPAMCPLMAGQLQRQLLFQLFSFRAVLLYGLNWLGQAHPRQSSF